MQATRVILKLTGELLPHNEAGVDTSHVQAVAQQVRSLAQQVYFGIVVGGGNLFRGARQSGRTGISEATGHTVGMIGTLMNSLIVQDIFAQSGIKTTLLTSFSCEQVGRIASQQTITQALDENTCTIFAGGLGVPYLSTDTTAVVRALQINAQFVWKATKVEGLYTKDPNTHKDARFINRISSQEVLEKGYQVMDHEAFSLAHHHGLSIRVFDIFAPNALRRVAEDDTFGSTVYPLK